MNKYKKLINLLKNGGLFIIIVVITFKMIFFNADFKEIIEIVSGVNLLYIAAGIAAMFLMVLCEAINIKRSLNIFKERTTLLQCVQYSLTGIFFSSITPSATGALLYA